MFEKWEALYRELPGEISFYEEKVGTGRFINTVLLIRPWHQNLWVFFENFYWTTSR